MKQRFLILASVIVVMGSGHVAQAAFSIEEVLAVTKIAVEKFRKENPTHEVGFTGYKAWKSEDASKVKVYVNHEGMAMEFNYLCEKHDALPECHAQ